MSIRDEGTISTTASIANANWASDTNGYRFGPIIYESIHLEAAKTPERRLMVFVAGPFGNKYEFNVAMPSTPGQKLQIVVTWKAGAVNLYLNGAQVHMLTEPLRE